MLLQFIIYTHLPHHVADSVIVILSGSYLGIPHAVHKLTLLMRIEQLAGLHIVCQRQLLAQQRSSQAVLLS